MCAWVSHPVRSCFPSWNGNSQCVNVGNWRQNVTFHESMLSRPLPGGNKVSFLVSGYYKSISKTLSKMVFIFPFRYWLWYKNPFKSENPFISENPFKTPKKITPVRTVAKSVKKILFFVKIKENRLYFKKLNIGIWQQIVHMHYMLYSNFISWYVF